MTFGHAVGMTVLGVVGILVAYLDIQGSGRDLHLLR